MKITFRGWFFQIWAVIDRTEKSFDFGITIEKIKEDQDLG